MRDADLTRENRKTGEERVPRVLRVRSVTPSIDMVDVRMVPGQTVRQWQDLADAIASALAAERVAITKLKPQHLRLVVEREDPFDGADPVEAQPIPESSEDVDLTALPFGVTEHGGAWTESVLGRHILGAGASGSGKGSLIWNPLRAMGPMIRDGLVRIRFVDPKRMESASAGPLFYQHSLCTDAEGNADIGDGVDVIESWRDDLIQRQKKLGSEGKRKFTVSRETPLDILIVDEIAMLSAYGNSGDVKRAIRLMAEGMTQGRAAGFALWGFVQEPTKDVLPVRDLFTTRICLAIGSANHVDGVLGDGMLQAGALAHEIPLGTHAGVGFVKHEQQRYPYRVRASWVADDDIAELVKNYAPEDPYDNVVELHGDREVA
ncbi:hypothetical protein [Actinoalloteichus spitiensis]|uniref:hypothetical protein n=1 Tax=Actinoalloteichus spitiensis TaxID=252394 RepID=UPI000365A0FF|nr:hypothetical protein [Actinoalloteichus spitiensis]